jgi:transposase-like protein
MNSRKRRHFTPQQKAEIVRRHLTGKEAVSALAEEFQVQPSQIHGWVGQVLAQAEVAFERKGKADRHERGKDDKITRLEAKLVQKNEVIAELMEENVRAKKANGEL